MGIFEELGIRPYINAHDTYTVYGGSRMSAETLEAMRQISGHFVDYDELQRKAGEKIAALTRNEGAYVTNGASGAILLATAVCLARGDAYRYMRLPQTDARNEVIILNCQHNAYDKAIAAAGAKPVMIGDADETLPEELAGVIGENTAAVFYFPNIRYEFASLPLETVIKIAHGKGVPVVVDAAALLPPVENLWRFTGMGADLAIFSGGKTLCGPQDSGLILGRADLIRDCQRFGAPTHGICRSSKTSREAIAGLYAAVKRYVEQDQEASAKALHALADSMSDRLKAAGLDARIVPYGPVGQTYPRVFARLPGALKAADVRRKMLEEGIYIGISVPENEIYISPLNLTKDEADTVIEKLIIHAVKEKEESQ